MNYFEREELVFLKLAGGGDVFFGEAIFAGDVDSVAEVGAYLFDAEAAGVTPIPGGGGTAAVGDPEESGGKVGGVFEGKPEVAVEDGGGPGQGLFLRRNTSGGPAPLRERSASFDLGSLTSM